MKGFPLAKAQKSRVDTASMTRWWKIAVMKSIISILVSALIILTAHPAIPAEDPAGSSAAWYEKGMKFVDTSQYDEAIGCFNRAIELDPNNEKALVARGSALLTVGRFEDAYQDLNRALAIDPADVSAYYVRGLVYEEAVNYEGAAADYTSALAIEPDNVDLLYRRGRVYREMGKTDEAASDFTRACELGYRYACEELNATP